MRGAWILLLLAGVADANDVATCIGIDDAAARLACYDRVAGRGTPIPVTPAAPVARAAPAPSASDFGAESVPPTPEERAAEQKSLKARIKGGFLEWKHNTVFELDNGQVWKVVGYDKVRDSTIPPDPAVTITRSPVGGYWMAIDAAGRSVRVRRVR